MTKIEIEEKIKELYKERDNYADRRNAIIEKYDKLADEECEEHGMSFDDWMDFSREKNAEIRALYTKLYELNEAENKDGKRTRQRSLIVDYFLNDPDVKEKRDEKRNKMECPKHMHTKDNLPNTDEKAKSLQERLVQTCIDYILETGDRDIDAVAFNADSLQTSANFGKWTSDTDSFITVKTYVWDDENKMPYLEKTGEYC